MYIALPLKRKYLDLLKWNKPGEAKPQKFRLVDHVSANWRDFGTRIGVTDNTMDGMPDNKAKLNWGTIMQKWLDGTGTSSYSLTWDGLCELIDDVGGYSAIIDELKEALENAVEKQ